MKMKASELVGPALDWAVSFADESPKGRDDIYWLPCLVSHFTPSTNWAQGGPIIERAGIYVMPCYLSGERRTGFDSWRADIAFTSGVYNRESNIQYGDTALVAAMRCYVTSKLGETVDIPDELL